MDPFQNAQQRACGGKCNNKSALSNKKQKSSSYVDDPPENPDTYVTYQRYETCNPHYSIELPRVRWWGHPATSASTAKAVATGDARATRNP